MHLPSQRITATISTIVLIAAMLGAIALLAAPAGASASFSPQLEPAVAPTEKFAPMTVASTTQLTNTAAKAATKITTSRTAATKLRVKTRAMTPSGEQAKAQSLLNSYIAKYPILKGSTVEFGDARGYQAIAYYQSGRIVISRSHTASLERIIGHEIWHIIDWRDNGRIDWGENVPPK